MIKKLSGSVSILLIIMLCIMAPVAIGVFIDTHTDYESEEDKRGQ